VPPSAIFLSGGDAASHSTRWAGQHLADVLRTRGCTVVDSGAADLRIEIAGTSDGPAESFRFARPNGLSGPIVVSGGDDRGLCYGILELADRVGFAADPLAELTATEPISQAPATPVRSILRVYVSEIQDPPWFYDRTFWTEYLTELAVNRINRFQLGFGMQYNYGHHPATDNYFCFAYPFLLDVPGYNVRADGVSAAERERNLEMLQFISAETKRRGMHFQLGLWNHAYDQGPESTHPITGLTAETHADYCAAALGLLLTECPDIDGITVRVHYEGGVPEPGHEFWRTVFAGVGRRIEIDMHAKGVDQGLLDIARETNLPVVIGAKHWAEHQGLPYSQTTIRQKERATKEAGTGLMSITAHQRRFTRYGYGDFLREGRDFDLLFRIWPGTQRVLLWGDPVLAAGYGRLGTLAGALGIELCEPLFFSGRKGSGTPDGRDPYADPELRLGGHEWRKYRYTYRLWGRLLYDPDADPDGWRRFLKAEYGAAAVSVEQALGAASRILPLVTVAHGLGASNNGYWPEMYVDMPIVAGPHADHYKGDTVSPPTFTGVSPFDPSIFSSIDDYADDLLAGHRDGRYSPDDVADRLDRLASDAERNLGAARENAADDPVFRRADVDITVLAGLGRFFAGKFRAGVQYALYERTKDRSHLVAAVDHLESARSAWAGIVATTKDVYRDLAFGELLSEYGHWQDRLTAIDTDLTALRELSESTPANATSAIASIPRGDRPVVRHQPVPSFARGADVRITVAADGLAAITLRYRHLNQGEDFRQIAMTGSGGEFTAAIPGSYTDSPYPLVYYFVARVVGGDAWLVPGLDETLANQPYHVVRQAALC
jgi:hypothetical protein